MLERMSLSDRPVRRADGRYDDVDFRKAAGHKFRPIKCGYNRRDVLLFVSLHTLQLLTGRDKLMKNDAVILTDDQLLDVLGDCNWRAGG